MSKDAVSREGVPGPRTCLMVAMMEFDLMESDGIGVGLQLLDTSCCVCIALVWFGAWLAFWACWCWCWIMDGLCLCFYDLKYGGY